MLAFRSLHATGIVCCGRCRTAAAVRWGSPVITMTLLNGGANANGIEHGRTALDHAVLGGNTDCVSLLIAAGAKLGVWFPSDYTSAINS